jgi:hypothetical protein
MEAAYSASAARADVSCTRTRWRAARVSPLCPVTFGGGALRCSEELAEGSLVCAGQGPTAYETARDELAYYFGDELTAELDALARREGVAPRDST